MLLAMFTWCCAFRSLFAMDIKKQGWHRQIREWLRLPFAFWFTLIHNESGLGMAS